MSAFTDRLAELKRQKRIAEAKAKPVISEPKFKESRLQKFGEGVASSAMSTAYGLKDLFTDLTDEEKERLKGLSESASESGYGTFGKVVGEIAQIALPAGAIGKVSKLPSVARTVPRIAKYVEKSPLAREVAVAFGLGASKPAEDVRQRLTRGGVEGGVTAVGGKVFQTGGKLLKGALKGVKRTPQAEKLISEGVPLTPGKSAESPFFPMAEEMAKKSGLVQAGRIQRAQDEAADVWRRNRFNQAVPSGLDDTITKTGTEGYGQLDDIFNREYSKAWSANTRGIDEDAALDMLAQIEEITPQFSVRDANILKRVENDIVKLADDSTPESFMALDKSLGELLGKTVKKTDLNKNVRDLRNGLRAYLPQESRKILKATDKAYPKKLALRNAVNASRQQAGEFTPQQLSTAGGQIGGKQNTALGQSPFHREASDAVQTIGRPSGASPEGMQGFYLKGISPLYPMRTLGGQMLPQRAAQTIGRTPTVQALRNIRPKSGALTGGTVFSENEGYY